MGKAVCRKTSLLPRSCVVSGHPTAIGASLLTCDYPATEKGSMSNFSGDFLTKSRTREVMVPAHTVIGGGGVRIHVEEAGNPQRPPVLFIHGFSQSLSHGSDSWSPSRCQASCDSSR